MDAYLIEGSPFLAVSERHSWAADGVSPPSAQHGIEGVQADSGFATLAGQVTCSQIGAVEAGAESLLATDVDCRRSFPLKSALGLRLQGIGAAQRFPAVWVNSAPAPT